MGKIGSSKNKLPLPAPLSTTFTRVRRTAAVIFCSAGWVRWHASPVTYLPSRWRLRLGTKSRVRGPANRSCSTFTGDRPPTRSVSSAATSVSLISRTSRVLAINSAKCKIFAGQVSYTSLPIRANQEFDISDSAQRCEDRRSFRRNIFRDAYRAKRLGTKYSYSAKM